VKARKIRAKEREERERKTRSDHELRWCTHERVYWIELGWAGDGS